MTESRLRCPECKQEKHQNCTRQAWDENTDTLTACLCSCLNGPHMERVERELNKRPGRAPERSFQESAQDDYYDGADL